MWNTIFVIIAIILFLVVYFLVFKSEEKFHDKSKHVTIGMSEEQVMEIMEDDPISIEQLKNGAYEWIYERRQWQGWGMMIVTIEILFNENKEVTSVVRTKGYDKSYKDKENY